MSREEALQLLCSLLSTMDSHEKTFTELLAQDNLRPLKNNVEQALEFLTSD
jgi:hypothetical protein